MFDEKIDSEKIINSLLEMRDKISKPQKIIYIIQPSFREAFEKMTNFKFGVDFITNDEIPEGKVVIFNMDPGTSSSIPEYIRFVEEPKLHGEILKVTMNRTQRRAAMKEQKKERR